jgi:uncharacterized tellurite resistance protein B-like protein
MAIPDPEPMAIQPLDLSPYPEDLRLDFYGALFAMSAADRDQDASEDDRIFASLDLGALSEDARKRVFQLAISPPPLERCLLAFKQADADLRHALLFNLIDVVLADGSIEPAEHVGLHQAREVLGISRDEMARLHDLAFEAQRVDVLRRPIRPTPAA